MMRFVKKIHKNDNKLLYIDYCRTVKRGYYTHAATVYQSYAVYQHKHIRGPYKYRAKHGNSDIHDTVHDTQLPLR